MVSCLLAGMPMPVSLTEKCSRTHVERFIAGDAQQT